MLAAIADARDAARGHEAVIVSHQLPVWTARRRLEGKRLWHDPRRRQCSLASLTSLTYVGDELASMDYCEPAAALLPGCQQDGGRMRRILGGVAAAVLAVGLAACSSDSNSIAAQARLG